MTPGARVAAAIDILDQIISGQLAAVGRAPAVMRGQRIVRQFAIMSLTRCATGAVMRYGAVVKRGVPE